MFGAQAGDPADGKTWAEHGTESGVAMENRSYYGKSAHATNESDLDLVIDTKAKLPADAKLILIVDADHPMIFSEIEPYADVILMGWAGDAGPSGSGFEIAADSFARVVTGKVEPTGLLQFQMPKDMDTVEAQLEDASRATWTATPTPRATRMTSASASTGVASSTTSAPRPTRPPR